MVSFKYISSLLIKEPVAPQQPLVLKSYSVPHGSQIVCLKYFGLKRLHKYIWTIFAITLIGSKDPKLVIFDLGVEFEVFQEIDWLGSHVVNVVLNVS